MVPFFLFLRLRFACSYRLVRASAIISISCLNSLVTLRAPVAVAISREGPTDWLLIVEVLLPLSFSWTSNKICWPALLIFVVVVGVLASNRHWVRQGTHPCLLGQGSLFDLTEGREIFKHDATFLDKTISTVVSFVPRSLNLDGLDVASLLEAETLAEFVEVEQELRFGTLFEHHFAGKDTPPVD